MGMVSAIPYKTAAYLPLSGPTLNIPSLSISLHCTPAHLPPGFMEIPAGWDWVPNVPAEVKSLQVKFKTEITNVKPDRLHVSDHFKPFTKPVYTFFFVLVVTKWSYMCCVTICSLVICVKKVKVPCCSLDACLILDEKERTEEQTNRGL